MAHGGKLLDKKMTTRVAQASEHVASGRCAEEEAGQGTEK